MLHPLRRHRRMPTFHHQVTSWSSFCPRRSFPTFLSMDLAIRRKLALVQTKSLLASASTFTAPALAVLLRESSSGVNLSSPPTLTMRRWAPRLHSPGLRQNVSLLAPTFLVDHVPLLQSSLTATTISLPFLSRSVLDLSYERGGETTSKWVGPTIPVKQHPAAATPFPVGLSERFSKGHLAEVSGSGPQTAPRSLTMTTFGPLSNNTTLSGYLQFMLTSCCKIMLLYLP